MNFQFVFLWVITVPLFRLDVLLEVVSGVDLCGPKCHNVVVTRSNERRFSEKVKCPLVGLAYSSPIFWSLNPKWSLNPAGTTSVIFFYVLRLLPPATTISPEVALHIIH